MSQERDPQNLKSQLQHNEDAGLFTFLLIVLVVLAVIGIDWKPF